MKTYHVKANELDQKWYLVDATGKTLGRLASQIAQVLRGKHKPIFTPNLDCGDSVVIINCEKIKLTGTKDRDKLYYRHSGYIGGIHFTSASDMLATHPDRLIRIAVKGMLPKNRLASKQLKKLKVYAGGEHPHQAQKLVDLPFKQAR